MSESDSTNVATATTTGINIVSIGVTYRSAKDISYITGDNSVTSGGEFEFDELNLIHDGTTVDVSEYGNLLTEVDSTADPCIRSWNLFCIYLESNVKLDWFPRSNKCWNWNNCCC